MKPLPPMPRPYSVNLESTLGCNLACVMCGSHLSGVTKTRHIMDPALIAQIEAEVLPGVRELSLTVAGEPFMTPKIQGFVDLASRTGAEIQLNTNATLLKDNKILRRVLVGASVIKISVDGATAEIYESIREGAEFPAVLANIRMLVRVREELPPAQRPRLAMCMVLMRRNVHQLPAMVEMACRLGLDRLEVAHLTVLSPALDAESLRHQPEEADRWIRAAREHADHLGFRVALPPLMDGSRLAPSPRASARLLAQELRGLTRTRVERAARALGQKARLAAWSRAVGGAVPCSFLQGGVFVTIGGDVAPCPMPGRPIAGNLREQPFDQIWNGPVLSAMRQGFLEGKPTGCCAHCSQNPHGYRPGDLRTVRPADGVYTSVT